jgi:hypothetical protein
VNHGAVLADDVGRDRELLAAQVVLRLAFHERSEDRVRALWEIRFEARDRLVWDGLEARVGDAVFDVGLAVEGDVDVFALQQELDVGEAGAAVGDEARRARQGARSGRGCGRWRCR